ncbi:hypothetical protein [Microlunatus aurantiacus]|uniref:hypothetical protein n=1 Tax=Microlunatus aurantiacus TaxID=446786 RepID=UPI0031D4F970
MSTQPQPAHPKPLLSLRSLVLILVALLIGGAATTLMIMTGGIVSVAVFAGAGAFAGCLKLLHDLVE